MCIPIHVHNPLDVWVLDAELAHVSNSTVHFAACATMAKAMIALQSIREKVRDCKIKEVINATHDGNFRRDSGPDAGML